MVYIFLLLKVTFKAFNELNIWCNKPASGSWQHMQRRLNVDVANAML